MNAHSLVVYVIAVVVAMITPGPDMMFVLATAAPAQFAVLGAIFITLELLIDGAVGPTAGRLAFER
jgi:threonine/homoserine/homoserine lactone efflux protein